MKIVTAITGWDGIALAKKHREFDDRVKTLAAYLTLRNYKTYFVKENFGSSDYITYTLGVKTYAPLPDESVSISLHVGRFAISDYSGNFAYRIAVDEEQLPYGETARWDRFISMVEDLTNKSIDDLTDGKIKYWEDYTYAN